MGATHFSGPVYSDNGFVGSQSGGAGSFTTLAASGATTLATTLAVTGASTLTGNTTVGGTLGVTGTLTTTAAAVVGTTLSVGTNLTVTGTTTHTGATTFNGNATFNANLLAAAATAIQLPGGTAASVAANFAADRYITVSDGSTTRYIPLANATW